VDEIQMGHHVPGLREVHTHKVSSVGVSGNPSCGCRRGIVILY